LTLLGVTTDGAHLSPEPLREVLDEGPHQVGAFHVVKDLGKAVWRAGARARQSLAAQQPTGPKGRPRTQAATQAARQKKRGEPQRADWCTPRHRCVQHDLKPRERKRLGRITRGFPL